MKRIIITLTALMITAVCAFAQETMVEDGKKAWETEYTIRYRAGLFTSGPMFTAGIRVDEKRTIGLFTGLEELWDDATPANIYSARIGFTFRRYWHMGKRKTFAFYSDLYAGAGYIYKVTSPDSYAHKGDVLFVGGWQPGIRVRCYKNLHIFLGPTLATDCLGLHLGIGF